MRVLIHVLLLLCFVYLGTQVLHDRAGLVLCRHLDDGPKVAAGLDLSGERGPDSDDHLEVVVGGSLGKLLGVAIANLVREGWKACGSLQRRPETHLLLGAVKAKCIYLWALRREGIKRLFWLRLEHLLDVILLLLLETRALLLHYCNRLLVVLRSLHRLLLILCECILQEAIIRH